MTNRPVFGLVLGDNDSALLRQVMSRLVGDVVLVTSSDLASDEITKRLLNEQGGWERIQAAAPLCAPLVRAVRVWPIFPEAAYDCMTRRPSTLGEWRLFNLLWQVATESVIYYVQEEALRTLDVTMYLTAARMMEHLSIGILPVDMRAMIESTQLTMTDVILGEAEGRSLRLLLGSLSKEVLTPDLQQVGHGEEEQRS